MIVTVIIPFTSEDLSRVRAWDHVVGWYGQFGWEIARGGCLVPWRKAVAVAAGARRSSGEILVVADADCLCSGVAAAVAAVEAGAPWAIPHLMVHRLDEVATAAVYGGADPAGTTGRAERPYRGVAGGGIVVVPRATYDEVPLDPRFEGFGQEDEAWALALTTLAGPPFRGTADLHHLHHPPQPRLTRHYGSAASRRLIRRYVLAARDGRQAMRSLLDETLVAA